MPLNKETKLHKQLLMSLIYIKYSILLTLCQTMPSLINDFETFLLVCIHENF